MSNQATLSKDMADTISSAEQKNGQGESLPLLQIIEIKSKFTVDGQEYQKYEVKVMDRCFLDPLTQALVKVKFDVVGQTEAVAQDFGEVAVGLDDSLNSFGKSIEGFWHSLVVNRRDSLHGIAESGITPLIQVRLFDEPDRQRTYVGKNKLGEVRFQLVRDMFYSDELAHAKRSKEPVTMNVYPKVRAAGPGEPKAATSNTQYHKISTVPLSVESHSASQLGPINRTMFFSYDPADLDGTVDFVEVTERVVDGISMADMSLGYDIDSRTIKGQHVEPAYQGLSSAEILPAVKANLEFMIENDQDEPQAPQLPNMTFATYQPRPTSYTLPEHHRIKLTIRMVNSLSTLEDKQIHLPANARAEITREETCGDIAAAIKQQMRDRSAIVDQGKARVDLTRMSRLFEHPLNGKWSLDMWVRPQGQELGKVYLGGEKDVIATLMDPEMARQGERGMYVEVYVVPK